MMDRQDCSSQFFWSRFSIETSCVQVNGVLPVYHGTVLARKSHIRVFVGAVTHSRVCGPVVHPKNGKFFFISYNITVFPTLSVCSDISAPVVKNVASLVMLYSQ